MKALVNWLRRLASVTPEPGPSISFFRVSVSGSEPLDVEDWILSIDPQGAVPNGVNATGPESWSVMRLPDLPRQETNLHDRHRLGAELASALSLALDRRVSIPNDFAITMPQLERTIFHPVSHIVDPGIQGPLPPDAKQRIGAYISAVAGLTAEDQEIIGAASSVYHSALLLFDKEPRVAYTLLVAGIETLSRKYGTPPVDWANWHESAAWSQFFAEQNLTVEQASALQNRLMYDRQLRLGATFQDYGATRPEDSFWQRPLDQWIYGVDANTGAWLPATKAKTCRVVDLLPLDRTVLRKSLAKSYNLRSAVVHEAEWVELMTMAGSPGQQVQSNRALPFPVLRTLLGELIQLEVSARSSPATLPDFRLLRVPPPIAA